MQGSEGQCTVLGGGTVPGLVVQILRFGTDEHHAVAIEGASPFTPLAWLVLLAGSSYTPVVRKGRTQVEVQPPMGDPIPLAERSKMHYLVACLWTSCCPPSHALAYSFVPDPCPFSGLLVLLLGWRAKQHNTSPHAPMVLVHHCTTTLVVCKVANADTALKGSPICGKTLSVSFPIELW